MDIQLQESLAESLRWRCKESASDTAIKFLDREQTYSQLDSNANHIAQGLLNLDIKPDSRIAYLAKNTDYFEIDWNHRLPNGHMSFFHGERVSAEDVKDSFPTDYSEADLFVGKMIEGKDYEFAFCEYDDAIEFDITNLDWICGDMRLHHNKQINDFYFKTEYNVWTKEAGLLDWMHLPVPLGKLVEVNSDLSKVYVDYDSTERTSDNRPVLNLPFKNVYTKIVV